MSFNKKDKIKGDFSIHDTKKKLHYKLNDFITKQKTPNKKENVLQDINRNGSYENIRSLKNQLSNYELIYKQCKQENNQLHHNLKSKEKQNQRLKEIIFKNEKKSQSEKFIFNQFKREIQNLKIILQEKEKQIQNLKQQCSNLQGQISELTNKTIKAQQYNQQTCSLNQQKINKMFQQINREVNCNLDFQFLIKKDQNGELSFGDREVKNNFEQNNCKGSLQILGRQTSQIEKIKCEQYLKNILRKNQDLIQNYQSNIKMLKQDIQYLQKHKLIQIQNVKITEQCKYSKRFLQTQSKMNQEKQFLLNEMSILRKQINQKNNQIIRLREKIDSNKKKHDLILQDYQKANKQLMNQIELLKKSMRNDLNEYGSLLQKEHEIQMMKLLKDCQKQKNELKSRIQTLKIILQQKNCQIQEVLQKKEEVIRIICQKNQKLIGFKLQCQKHKNFKSNNFSIKNQAKQKTLFNEELVQSKQNKQNKQNNIKVINQLGKQQDYFCLQHSQTQNVKQIQQKDKNSITQTNLYEQDNLEYNTVRKIQTNNNKTMLLQKEQIILESLSKYIKNK